MDTTRPLYSYMRSDRNATRAMTPGDDAFSVVSQRVSSGPLRSNPPGLGAIVRRHPDYKFDTLRDVLRGIVRQVAALVRMVLRERGLTPIW